MTGEEASISDAVCYFFGFWVPLSIDRRGRHAIGWQRPGVDFHLEYDHSTVMALSAFANRRIDEFPNARVDPTLA